jgi:hypothetical protein
LPNQPTVFNIGALGVVLILIALYAPGGDLTHIHEK